MENNENILIANFVDILELMLPSINVTEDMEIVCDEEALKSHKLEDKKNKNGKIILKKGIYKNDYRKDKFRGFFCITPAEGLDKIHLGIDFSYGKENVMSCMHPPVYSPISGTIEEVNEKEGSITIRNREYLKKIKGKEKIVNYYHTLKHLDEIYVKSGEVYAGESCLGTMGGTGEKGRYTYVQHIHYQITLKMKHFTGSYDYETEDIGIKESLDTNDRLMYLDPEKFWDIGMEAGVEEFSIVEKKKL